MYDLLSRLFLQPPNEEIEPYVAAIPALAAALPTPLDGDALAVAYQDTFGFNVFPYQAIFLDASGLLGGAETARVQAALAATGYRPDPENADDHIGEELAFLGFLCGAEADALRDGLEATAGQLRVRQVDFLTDHLLRWLAPFAAAMARTAAPFYAALTELTVDVVADHVNHLGVHAESIPPVGVTLHLDDDKTDLRTIVDYLLQPSSSGIYLARADLIRLGRAFDLPRGFGDRRQMFLNLLRAAATYEEFAALSARLAEEAEDYQKRYIKLTQDHPALTPWLHGWQTQATVTANLLRTGAAMAALDLNELAGVD
jgi:TorA maturation chaperone TorD